MTNRAADEEKNMYLQDCRFAGLQPFEQKIWLSSPTMHGEELRYVEEAVASNWVSTLGENIDAVEQLAAARAGCKHAVALSSATAALHMALRLCAQKVYGAPSWNQGALAGHKVFCSDMTFSATANPIVYEGGEPVFVDAERDTWNMDPAALARAFEREPEVKIIMLAHLYGTPARMDEIIQIAKQHQALIVEDAAESLGAVYGSRPTGSLGTVGVVSFNGNKIITGSAGGVLLTDDPDGARLVKKWASQSREPAPWYQHEALGYNYRMSNIVAGVLRGQFSYLDAHIAQKRALYMRYREGLRDVPLRMNPFEADKASPNHWLSCFTIEPDAMCRQDRGAKTASFVKERGKTCPTEVLQALAAFHAEGRPLWKPMHMQPFYRQCAFVTREDGAAVDEDLFARGVCLPSDNKITAAQAERIMEIVRRCFR